MPKPTATVDYRICQPERCGCQKDPCLAVLACEHKVMQQEARGEPPFTMKMCLGCGTCVTACPLKAIKLL